MMLFDILAALLFIVAVAAALGLGLGIIIFIVMKAFQYAERQ